MMLDRTPRIVQEAGSLDRLGLVAGRYAGSGPVLLVADAGLAATGITDRAERALRGSGLGVVRFEGFKSDPTMASVDLGADLARSERAGLVVSLGGGSALDVGKAIAAIAAGSRPAADYALRANPLPPRPLAKICVPTTSGTGSETTRVSVLALPDGTKTWIWGDEVKADEVLLDPTTTVGLPPALTAATGIDALIHGLEAATNRNAFAANDVYAHAAIRLAAENLLSAVERPEDLAARAGLQLAATFAGIAIDNAGTSIAHCIGHALASLRPIHHGRAVGVAALATLAWSAEGDPGGQFSAVASAMGIVGGAAALAGGYADLLRRSGLAVSLAHEGQDHVTAEALAERMLTPENLPMLRASVRVPGEGEILAIAGRVLQQA